MNYSSSYQDVFYAYTGDTLDYGLYLGTIPLFFGRCVKRPGAASANININKICQDSLDAGFPFSNESGLTYGEFSLYRIVDGEPFELLGEYGLLLSFDRDYSFNGQSDFLSDPINGRADSRMKMVYSVFMDTTGQTVCEEQALHKRITIHPNTLNVGSGATAVTLTIEANYEYEVYVDGSPDWVTLSQSSGASGTTIITVNVGENPYADERRAMIYVDEYQIPLIQEALVPIIIVNPTEIELTSLSGTSSITVSANTGYEITRIPDWIHFTTTTGASGETIFTFTYDETTLDNERTAEIKVGGETVHITQRGLNEPFVLVSPSAINATHYGGQFILTVTANTRYGIGLSDDWFTIDRRSGESGITEFTVTVRENHSTSGREGYILVSGNRVSVSQIAGFLSITPSALTFDGDGGTSALTITSNYDYEITTNDPWIQLSANSGQSGTTVVYVTGDYNSGDGRSGIVMVDRTPVPVYQGMYTYIAASPTAITTDCSGDTFTITVSSNTHYNITTPDAWCVVSKNSDTGDTTFTITVQPYDGAENRTGTVIIGNANNQAQISVYQERYHYEYEYLTLEILSDGYIRLRNNPDGCNFDVSSKTNDEEWVGFHIQRDTYHSIAVSQGDIVKFKAETDRDYTHSSNLFGNSYSTARFNVKGNLLSMVYGDAFTYYYDIGYDSIPYNPERQFNSLFKETNVVDASALILPAGGYNELFAGCTQLVYPPAEIKHPDHIFRLAFAGCTSMVKVPRMHIDEMTQRLVSSSTYERMFIGCTSLTDASGITVTTTNYLKESFSGTFSACTNLVSADIFDQTVTAATFHIGDSAFADTFNGCSSLTNVNLPPAYGNVSIGGSAFEGTFENCTSLVNAPALPYAETATYALYASMFRNCTSLVTAPDILSRYRGDSSFNDMFNGCSHLQYVKCLVEGNTTTQPYSFDGWLSGAPATGGTFVKKAGAIYFPNGTYGIPSNWTVIEV